MKNNVPRNGKNLNFSSEMIERVQIYPTWYISCQLTISLNKMAKYSALCLIWRGAAKELQ